MASCCLLHFVCTQEAVACCIGCLYFKNVYFFVFAAAAVAAAAAAAAVNDLDSDARPPLHYAACRDKPEYVRWLLQQGKEEKLYI